MQGKKKHYSVCGFDQCFCREIGNLAMFRYLADISELNEALKTDVAQDLENLENEFK